MRSSPTRTILLVLASAIGGIVVFIAAVVGYLFYRTSGGEHEAGGRLWPPETVVSKPPPVVEAARYLGGHGLYYNGFDSESTRVLEKGPSRLIGRVMVGDRPVKGLKLRLALNGKVFSQWSVSGEDGSYSISLPYADYRIDGYTLDAESANKVLPGLINDTMTTPVFGTYPLKEGQTGRAPDLNFIVPVKITSAKGYLTAGQLGHVEWQTYPGAKSYRLQVTEQKAPGDFASSKQLFEWQKRPEMAATTIDLAKIGVTLRTGYCYFVEIEAMDEQGAILSHTARAHNSPDFIVTAN